MASSEPHEALHIKVMASSKEFSWFGASALATMTKPPIPKNTEKNTSWGLRNFREWRDQREKNYPDEICRPDLINSLPWKEDELCHWLCLYILETRHTDGKQYPISTIYQLLSAILRHMREIDPDCPNFLSKDNHRYRVLHATIDNLSRKLRTEGVGAEVKHTSVISPEEENALWESDVLGVKTPKSLLYAVFYKNGQNVCLRGGAEHRNLKLSQLQHQSNPD